MTPRQPAIPSDAPDDPAVLCSCHTTSMSTPGGEIVMVRVLGEVDPVSEHVLRAALAEARARRADHLVVDVAGVGFCSVRGLALLVDEHTEMPPGRTRYLLSGVGPYIGRYLDMLWPPDRLPVRHPTATSAVLAAMAHQLDRRTSTARPARVGPGERREPADDITDLELTARARAGDSGAYRALAGRHRTRMYRSALRMLGAAEDPADVADVVADDIATRLRTALTAFDAATPP